MYLQHHLRSSEKITVKLLQIIGVDAASTGVTMGPNTTVCTAAQRYPVVWIS